MKIFISQPMGDKTDEEIKAERKKIEDACKLEYGTEVEFVDSFFEGAPHDATPLWFLGESIKLLGTADAVFFADGWKDYRGCRTEHFVAEQYGIKIICD
jgi:hypothetical protein